MEWEQTGSSHATRQVATNLVVSSNMHLSSQFCRSEDNVDLTGLSVQGLTGCSHSVGWAVFSFGDLTGEDLASKLIQVVRRMQFLTCVGLRFPLSLLDVI